MALHAAIAASSSGDNTIVAAVTGERIRVLAFCIVAAGTCTARFEDGAGGAALTGQISLSDTSGVNSGYCPVGHFETTPGTLLNLELSAAVSVAGWLVYEEA